MIAFLYMKHGEKLHFLQDVQVPDTSTFIDFFVGREIHRCKRIAGNENILGGSFFVFFAPEGFIPLV